jgi:hypothetical protein
MVVGQYLYHGWAQLAARGYPGWHSGGSYGWLVYPQTVSKPLLSSICARMCKRMGSIYRIILGGTVSSNHLQRGTALIHLILLSINSVYGDLLGSVKVISDCLGALKQVTDLPPYRIPSRCKHSNILKNILVNCWALSFTKDYIHVKVHQDESVSFANLSQKAQFSCICDHTAK